MQAEMMAVAGRVAVEQRWKDSKRDRRRDEARARRQRREDPVTELARDLAVGRQLLVSLDQSGSRAGCRAAVLPRGRIHDAAELRHIMFAQDIGNTDQHRVGVTISISIAPKEPCS